MIEIVLLLAILGMAVAPANAVEIPGERLSAESGAIRFVSDACSRNPGCRYRSLSEEERC